MAWFGASCSHIALMSVASIVGRALSGLGLGLGPVPGDFELVEAGTALAVFCFLPWCHLKAATRWWTCCGAVIRRHAACLTSCRTR